MPVMPVLEKDQEFKVILSYSVPGQPGLKDTLKRKKNITNLVAYTAIPVGLQVSSPRFLPLCFGSLSPTVATS